MHKAKRIYALLGVLVVICIAALAVSQHEEKKEQIKSGEKIILEIPTDSVTVLSWTNEEGTFSFTKGSSWTYDGDSAFPVDREKIESLISQFKSFTAAFTIENVEDEALYGLDEPVCTISVTTDEETYQLKLGDFSKMDAQRYISIGDGCAYLAAHDPLEEFAAVLRDMILDDTIPAFDSAEEIKFTGTENYTITQNADGQSICADDIYFTDGRPLDTTNIESYMTALQALSLTDYVTYNASDEELQEFGLDDPDLMIEVKYAADEKREQSGSVVLSVSRSPEEAEAYEKAVEQGDDDLPTVTCYARVGQSPIVYRISQSDYNQLTAVSYDTLRHQKLFTASFDTVTSMEIELDGESYTLTYELPEEEDAEGKWMYQEEEFDVYTLRTALRSLSAVSFTEEQPEGKKEIKVTLHLDNAYIQTFELSIYRCDGTNCIAEVDGVPTAFVSRAQTVNLIEAVNELILGTA